MLTVKKLQHFSKDHETEATEFLLQTHREGGQKNAEKVSLIRKCCVL